MTPDQVLSNNGHFSFQCPQREFSDMKQQTSDLVGTLCSGLCLLHCLAAPLLIASGGLGVIGSLMLGETFHWLLIGPLWVLVLFSFPRAFRQHGAIHPLIFAAIGISAVTLALFGEGHWETVATVIGGLCLMFAHIRNWTLMADDSAESQDTATA